MTAATLRRNAVNIALAVAACAGIVAVIATRRDVTTAEREAREGNLLSAFRPDDLSRISIERGPTKLVLERAKPDDAGEAAWNLLEPVREEADVYSVDKLLGSLEFARVVRRIKPQEVDRAGFGLDAPAWVMTLQMGRIRYVLRLGKEAASPPGSHYLELLAEGSPGSGVVLVSRDLVTELGIDASALRGRQVVPYLSNTLAQISIRGTDGVERRLKSAGHDRWRFTGMEADVRIHRDSFDKVLVQFARTKAEHFIEVAEGERAQQGAKLIRLVLEPTDAAKPKAEIEVGGVCPKSSNDVVALRRAPDPIAACVPKSVLPGLDTPVAELVDRTAFTLRKDEVESLLVVRAERRLELDRKDAGFLMRAPVKGEVDLETGNQRLDALVRAEGTLVAAPNTKELGLEPPQGRATVKSAAEQESSVVEETIEIGRPTKDGKLPIRRLADGAVLLLGPDAARLLDADSTLVRSRKILDFPPSAFRTLELKGKNVLQSLRREEPGTFTLEQPKGHQHDAGLAAAAVDALGSLTAERWVAERDDGSFGLTEPRLQARVGWLAGDSGAQQATLVVGALVSGGAYARVDGEPGVFILPRRALDALEIWWLDRSVFMVTPDSATRIELERAGKKLVLDKQGDGFVRSSGLDVSTSQIGEVVEALTNLRAEAAVHLGPARVAEGLDKPELLIRVEPPGDAKRRTMRIGAGDAWQSTSVHFARAEGVDATYVIAKNKVRPLLDLF